MVIFSEEAKAKFWSQVDVQADEECWLWQGYTQYGNGVYSIPNLGKTAISVFAWAIFHSESPHQPVLHTCNNKLCVNPAHLILKGGK